MHMLRKKKKKGSTSKINFVLLISRERSSILLVKHVQAGSCCSQQAKITLDGNPRLKLNCIGWKDNDDSFCEYCCLRLHLKGHYTSLAFMLEYFQRQDLKIGYGVT